MSKHHYTYLALGDSYTIGESVPLHESFPYLTVQQLRKAGYVFHAPEIVAKTGWTSFELAEHLLHTRLNEQYDFVSLLIGVNNQYRKLSPADFQEDFSFLLRKAIHLAGDKADHVFVLSIPDWGLTKFGRESKRTGITEEITAFNTVCRETSVQNKVRFIDISSITNAVISDPLLLAADGLHYSGKAHAAWAVQLASAIMEYCKR
jgi:lysophospholipase L1-like esterase